LRSGQAHHDTDAKETVATETSLAAVPAAPEGTDVVILDEENLQETVDEATEDIKEAEKAQLQDEEAMLESATSKVTNMIRIRMGNLFGKTLTSDEVEQVATQVEGELMTEANKMLRTRADSITSREIDNLEGLVEDEEQAGYETEEIEGDVYEQELGAVDTVKEDIDAAAITVKDSLKSRAAAIEKAILEERLSAKLGKRVKLVIMDDEVQGVDELFEGLTTMAPPAAATTNTAAAQYPPSTGYSNNRSPYLTSSAASPGTTTYGTPPATTTYGASPNDDATPAVMVPPAATKTTFESLFGGKHSTTTTRTGESNYGAPKTAYTTEEDSTGGSTDQEEESGQSGDEEADNGNW
jgi:hypothetical protein